MEADVRRIPPAGVKNDDRRPSAKSSARAFTSSPPAFGDRNSNLNNKSKGRGTSLVINEGGYLEKKEPVIFGKGKNVISSIEVKKSKSPSNFMFGNGYEASPSKLLPIEKIIPDNGNSIRNEVDRAFPMGKDGLVCNEANETANQIDGQGREAFTTHSFHHSPVRQRTVVLLHNPQCWQRTVVLSHSHSVGREPFGYSHSPSVGSEPFGYSHSPSVGSEPFGYSHSPSVGSEPDLLDRSSHKKSRRKKEKSEVIPIHK
ncbi:hypothetical protein MA16_Dca018434 [Dendrobium catenatum]|uniref:Uncharacterized protein n=1 Tax=Dendrobium catenatum TaxID=906689 RepID=A0A2I0VNC8_9ASPA|nr:hypothetical protein MA16_Dca018434 [Dendrobium catenatum]